MLLSQEDRTKVEAMRRKTRDKKEHVRLSVLIMLDSGYSREVIAESQGIDTDTVTNYKHKYEQQGLQAYLQDNYVAYQGLLSGQQLSDLNAHVQAGVLATARQVGDWVAQQWQLDYSDSAIRAILSKLDFVHKKVKLMPSKADARKQEAFVEEFNRVIADLASDTVVYFGDATHPTHNTRPDKAWIKKGHNKYIAANSGRKRVNLNGLVNAKDPTDIVVLEAETVNAQNTIALYQKLLAHQPGKKLLIICDNAPYYRSGLLQNWLKDQLLLKQWFLPTYSPNLNLIERLWGFMKQKVASLTFYSTYKEFKAAILNFFRHIDQYEFELNQLLTLKFQILNAPPGKPT